MRLLLNAGPEKNRHAVAQVDERGDAAEKRADHRGDNQR